MHIVQLVNQMHPSPLGEAHYSLVHASFLKRYQLQYILLGDLREVPYQMGMGTYPMHNNSSYQGQCLS